MLSAYVFAAFGTYGLVLSLTRSMMAALVAGLIYSLGGFMISHSGHYDIVQPAAWTPAVMWALSELRKEMRFLWVALGNR